ncbi:hypothetical protein [Pedobacter foliorum]|uniref:hypothetical protein n=1 Tax=Pedobacter foliorum TaxID=2739058 RepID=UPI001563C49C|nr:hypothetical protein [Pedobacter foliorum]NRF37744.1 hypothetical protein [Pedobacter foliorum]
MKSDLEELIEAYEIEKAELEKQISEYLEEADYIYAHYHNKALEIINRRLDVLRNLHNPFYLSIAEEEWKISTYSKLLAKPEYKYQVDFFSKYLRESENKVINWKQASFSPKYDSQEVDDALFDLVNGTGKGFKLYFKTDPNIFASFALGDHFIEIKLFYDVIAEYDYQYIFEKVNQLKALGFNLREGQWIYH